MAATNRPSATRIASAPTAARRITSSRMPMTTRTAPRATTHLHRRTSGVTAVWLNPATPIVVTAGSLAPPRALVAVSGRSGGGRRRRRRDGERGRRARRGGRRRGRCRGIDAGVVEGVLEDLGELLGVAGDVAADRDRPRHAVGAVHDHGVTVLDGAGVAPGAVGVDDRRQPVPPLVPV